MKERIEAEIERLETEILTISNLVRLNLANIQVADAVKVEVMKNQAFLKSLLEEDNGLSIRNP